VLAGRVSTLHLRGPALPVAIERWFASLGKLTNRARVLGQFAPKIVAFSEIFVELGSPRFVCNTCRNEWVRECGWV
jgi:hypothetical protein